MNSNQVRLPKGLGLAFGIPTLIALGAGIWLRGQAPQLESFAFWGWGTGGVDTENLSKDKFQKELTGLKDQAFLLNEYLWSSFEEIRVRATTLKKLRDQAPSTAHTQTPNKPILFWVEWGLVTQNGGTKIGPQLQSSFHPKIPAELKTEIEKELAPIASLIDVKTAQKIGVTFNRSLIPSKDGQTYSILTFSYAQAGPNTSLLSVWVNTQEAFPLFQKYAKAFAASELKQLGLITQEGLLITHSDPARIGKDLSKESLYLDDLRKIFRGEQSSLSTLQHPTKTSHLITLATRVGTLPLVILAQEKVLAPSATGGSWSKLGRSLALALGLTLLSGVLALMWIERKWKEAASSLPSPLNPALGTGIPTFGFEAVRPHVQIEPHTPPTKPAGSPRPELRSPTAVIAPPLSVSTNASSGASAGTRLQTPPIEETEGEQWVQRFKHEAAKLRDPKLLSYRLSEIASRLCESPVLYFHFQDNLQAALLQAATGFDRGKTPDSMSFPLPPEVQGRIITGAQNGKMVSLSNYEPLTRMILSKTGVAHFEAWAVTSSASQLQLKPEVKLLGILVILHSSTQSSLHRKNLSQMMRTLGESNAI